ncbi:MAG: hypothetical protein IKY22_06150 [Bacteroidales bacterium]|nr:hypothetical protein [Bacteroidales bacterium]
MKVVVKQVETEQEKKQFVGFPDKLFMSCNSYVPQLHTDEYAILFGSNIAKEYCKFSAWLAYSNGEVVGRIAIVINTRANILWNNSKVRFGWFDFVEDFEVCKALMQVAELYAKENSCNYMHGPTGFTEMDRESWIVEGFSQRHSSAGFYNYPYYIDYIKRLGYSVDCEWLQYKMPASQPVPEKVERINALILFKYKLKLLEFSSKKDIIPYAHKFFELLNTSFKDLYEYVPLTDKEIEYYTKVYFTFLDPSLVKLVVDSNNDIVAFAVALPSLTEAYKKARGKMFPIGWFYLLRALKKYNEVDLLLNGVHPDWQRKGIHSIYHSALNKTLINKGVKWAYSNPQIVTNIAVKVWDNTYESELIIKRACFAKVL